MAEKEPSSYDTSSSTRKRIRQTISVPFCWEERPGTPIKNWKPTTAKPFSLPPVKLIASIPFQWEEKPGTPLPCFLEPLSTSILALPPPDWNVFHVSSPMHASVYDDDDDEILSESDSDDSFETANSLLGNGLISSVTLSNAVPFESAVISENHPGISIDSPVSDTESEISSYTNGTAMVAGASLLEWLFPLLTPRPETVVSNVEVANHSKDLGYGKKPGVSTKIGLTLGELIMMSRRQSYHRKAIKMQKQNLSKGGPNWRGFRCCIFRASKILHKIQMDWKRQLQIKLM